MKAAFAVFGITLLAYALTAGGHLYSPDEELLFRTTQSLAEGRGLLIEPLGGFATVAPTPPDPDGSEYAQYGIGQPMLALPFYYVGRALASLASSEAWTRVMLPHWASPHDLFFAPTEVEFATRFAVSWFNIVLGALAAALVCVICRELVGRALPAALAALLYSLGSIAWAHSRPFYTEIAAGFFVLLAFHALLRAHRPSDDSTAPHEVRASRLGWFALAGLATGYAVLVRTDSAIFFPGLGLLLLWPLLRPVNPNAELRPRAKIAALVAFALPAIVCGAVFLWLNTLRFGGPFTLGHSDEPEGIAFSTPLLAGLYGFLFSVGKGVFFFSPALTLSFLGWRPLYALSRGRHPAILGSVILLIGAFLVFQSKWQNWAGGWTWGPRHIFQIHALLAFPIAAWLAEAWRPATRIVVITAFIVGGAVQLFGASVDFIEFHRRYFRLPEPARQAAQFERQLRSINYIRYDGFDEAYWSRYFRVVYQSPDPATPPRPMSALALPAPIQHSLYVPGFSPWAGYPAMLREGYFDNFWWRLATAPRAVPPPSRDPLQEQATP